MMQVQFFNYLFDFALHKYYVKICLDAYNFDLHDLNTYFAGKKSRTIWKKKLLSPFTNYFLFFVKPYSMHTLF